VSGTIYFLLWAVVVVVVQHFWPYSYFAPTCSFLISK